MNYIIKIQSYVIILTNSYATLSCNLKLKKAGLFTKALQIFVREKENTFSRNKFQFNKKHKPLKIKKNENN